MKTTLVFHNEEIELNKAFQPCTSCYSLNTLDVEQCKNCRSDPDLKEVVHLDKYDCVLTATLNNYLSIAEDVFLVDYSKTKRDGNLAQTQWANVRRSELRFACGIIQRCFVTKHKGELFLSLQCHVMKSCMNLPWKDWGICKSNGSFVQLVDFVERVVLHMSGKSGAQDLVIDAKENWVRLSTHSPKIVEEECELSFVLFYGVKLLQTDQSDVVSHCKELVYG